MLIFTNLIFFYILPFLKHENSPSIKLEKTKNTEGLEYEIQGLCSNLF